VPAAADTSVLVWLAMIGRLSLLRDQYQEILIPSEVYHEAVEEGLREGYSDAPIIKDAVDKGWIRVTDAHIAPAELDRLTGYMPDVHRGEAAAILTALGARVPLLIDETSGRELAEVLGLKPHGTLHVILAALRRGEITKEEAKEALGAMITKGFRVDPRLLARTIAEIDAYRPRNSQDHPRP
jgi:predicted nucleic acid-binding protein